MPVKKRSCFDPSKDIQRNIEKVISYGASQESRLKAEISEYVVTESIEEQFRKLLDRMQLAMEAGGENEIGVWVSGFYGSGKSSFTKYLGMAFDDKRTVDGTPFINHLQARRAMMAQDSGGFSGSLVWNTRYLECVSAGREWKPEQAVVTGLLRRWDTSTKTLLAWRVEHLRAWLEAAAERI
ncbi:hypothetical protein FHW02_003811 [Ochrobactrum sp. RH1CCR137]|nr:MULTISPECIES: hypothetical protein [unclassified Ochrobactrum]MBA8845725.1 hypothetical protein [Ochrobactrum sp. RH1CCR137]MBA8857446.1 hypothetical protein [Ochrobactrum sp. RH1CCR134]